MTELMHFNEVVNEGADTAVLVTHGLRMQPYNPGVPLQLTKDVAFAFPGVDVSEIHRDDVQLFKNPEAMQIAAKYLNKRVEHLKSTRKRVIALGVSLGGIVSGLALKDSQSALDSVITISMPTDLDSQPVPQAIKNSARRFTDSLPLFESRMDCIYGGRDHTVSKPIVEACNRKQPFDNGVRFHEVPMMTHRSIGHFKAEIKTILEGLI